MRNANKRGGALLALNLCESTDCEYTEQAIACVSALFVFGGCPDMSMERVAWNANKRGGVLLALNYYKFIV